MNEKPTTTRTLLPDGPLPARVIAGQPEPTWTVEARMAAFDVPAVSAAVVDGMDVVWAEAWGLCEKGQSQPATPTTLFQTASISKSVAAIGALRLVRDGLLDLDAEISTVLHNWHLPRGDYQGEVTLRRLLAHTAGTGVPGFEGYPAQGPFPTLIQMLEGTPPANSPAVRLVAPPGEQFSYSGGGYQIVQKLMQDVTGEPFAQIMRERVFEPLGMHDSTYAPLDPALHDRAASGHVNGAPIPGKGPVHMESAAGGLWSTPSDLLQLTLEEMRAYRGETGPVLTPELAHAMLTPAFWNYGLGYRVLGEGDAFRFSHGGATRGWHGQIHAYPARGQSVALLTNDADGYIVWPEVERGIARALGWPDWEPEVLEPTPMREADLAPYLGTYGAGGFAFEIRPATLGESEDAPLGLGLHLEAITWHAAPTEPDVFELIEFEGQVLFERAPDGTIQSFDVWFGQPDWSPYRRWTFNKVAP
jgi:CubicO group peptidase (beta-lactamase class C family)